MLPFVCCGGQDWQTRKLQEETTHESLYSSASLACLCERLSSKLLSSTAREIAMSVDANLELVPKENRNDHVNKGRFRRL